MNRICSILTLFLIHCLCFDDVRAVEIQYAERCAPFQLPNHVGRNVALADFRTPLIVIAFLGTDCPLAKRYAVKLEQMSRTFSDDLTVLGINSNRQDSQEDIQAFVNNYELSYPMLIDRQQQVADQLGAKRTPEVFLLDAERKIQYRGRIDDQYGIGFAHAEPQRADLLIAIQELLAGKSVSKKKTQTVGCLIGRNRRPPTGEVTFADQVIRVLQRNCIECHQKGQIAPFALTEYEEVVGWADTIREVVEQRRMPPWHADFRHESFSNARQISDEDKRTLFAWIDHGMPAGNLKGLPKLEPSVQGWSLPREPDQVVAMSDEFFEVPATGIVEYQYFVADPGFTEDRWVTAAQVTPGAPSVVHHAIVFVRPPGGEQQTGLGWLTAFVPGQNVFALPAGMARRIPKGSKLVFQLHYTPTGVAERDRTKVGLLFADAESIHTEVQTRIAVNREFEIPPGAKNYQVPLSADGFPPGSRLLAVAPHMHYRGKRFEVRAVGETLKTLLHVPNYDFNWQHAYVLQNPMPLEGVRIECTATFDNSVANVANPDANATVRWGDQTWEEMALVYLMIGVPRKKSQQEVAAIANANIVSEVRRKKINSAAEQEQRALDVAKQFFKQMDRNQDGEILRAETPTSFRAFAWRFFDTDDDGKLKWDEVLHQARLSVRP